MIQKYLLEKTRIVSQLDGERNFHIFYQLIRGAPEDLRRSLSLSSAAEDYSYLSHRESIVASIDDADDYQTTTSCMNSVGLDTTAQFQVFSLLSGILHLGNVEFDPDTSEGQVGGVSTSSQEAFETAASLLGVDSQEFLFALTKQNMYVSGQTIVKTQTQSQVIIKKNDHS